MNEIDIPEKVKITIKSENVTFKKDVTLAHNASLIMKVNGDSTFDGNIQLIKNNHEITINGDALFNGDITIGKNDSVIAVKGDAAFNEDIKFEGNNAKIIVDGYTSCEKEDDLGKDTTINKSINCS
ncbi:hypothetical protein [Virgibacillus necropolis]|uniref:Cell shape determination protein CcmA n=1 Tax=Virgibacillus necropolis TaxID=163877 RepID=A0A221MBE7_9BACI|nr:hypothetical protein [Virgibacillus necropolis]ASN04998.1 hypothetical protein CFK40_08225 [Virgibacillus necropolis]